MVKIYCAHCTICEVFTRGDYCQGCQAALNRAEDDLYYAWLFGLSEVKTFEV